MSGRTAAAAAPETREERIEAIRNQLRPKIETTVRHMVERAVDAPGADEFGAIDFEFRDAGQRLANDVRQAGLASRKKLGRQTELEIRRGIYNRGRNIPEEDRHS